MHDPFLIDECLSPKLMATANTRGHHATHIIYRGLEGTPDRDLLPIILSEGWVFVTSNARDFLKLFKEQDLHPGLIIIVPGRVRTLEQMRLFNLVLDVIEPLPDLINKVVEISAAGDVTIRELSAA